MGRISLRSGASSSRRLSSFATLFLSALLFVVTCRLSYITRGSDLILMLVSSRLLLGVLLCGYNFLFV